MTDIATNIESVKAALTAALENAGRTAGGTRLVAVSKTRSVPEIQAAIEAGQKIFGENRVQEALAKWPALKAAHPGTELHLIGSLQTNKTRQALDLFDVIQTLDRPKLARAIRKEIDRRAQGAATPRLYIQVNTGEETQKGGVSPADLPALLTLCRSELGLKIAGLMCIPPAGEDAASHFAMLAELAEKSNLTSLSMGMSADYELAAAMGATDVRVGTSIFGPRQTAN